MRRVRRGPILLLVIAALVAAVVLQDDDDPAATTAARESPILEDPGVPAADALSASWFCADGTSSPDGRADETIMVASVSDEPIAATVTVMPGGDASPASRTLRLEPRTEERVRVADVLATPEPGVVVEVVGGQAVVAHEVAAGGDVASEPCARRAADEWYFAAGTTVRGAQQFLALFNPFGDDAIVDVSFVTETGVQEPDALQARGVPRRSRIGIPVHDFVPRQQLVGIEVRARSGRVVAERSQVFDGTTPEGGPARSGVALSLGAAAPRREWSLPYGTTEGSGGAFVGVANFGSIASNVEVEVVLEGDQSLSPLSLPVPARGVVAVDVSERVPAGSHYSVRAYARTVEGSSSPIVVEMLASWPGASSINAVASSLGSPRAARRWVVALPGADADGIVTVLNPGPDPLTAELLAFASDGGEPSSAPAVAIEPGRMATFGLGPLGGGGQTVAVVADRDVVAGLTLIGPAGASTMAAVPDFGYPTPI